jgi:hypothetical protein
MAYSTQQIYDAMVAGNQAGLSNADVFARLADYGISPTDAMQAYQTSRPDLFAQPEQIMGNVTAGNYDANTYDPKYQALTQMEDYTRQFAAPAPDPTTNYFSASPTGEITSPYGNGWSTAVNDASTFTPTLPATTLPALAAPTAPTAPAMMPPTNLPALPAPTMPTSTPPAMSSPMASPASTGSLYPGQNPYLSSMADDITRRVNLSRDMGLNAIRGHAIGVGGLGGSRQGIAEGLAIGQSADNLAGQLAGMYGQDWNNSANRDLTRYQADQSFYNQGRELDQLGQLRGAQTYGLAQQNQWYPLLQANSIFNTTAGNNVTGTTGGTQGGGWQGLLGGALAGGSLAKQAGWWGV